MVLEEADNDEESGIVGAMVDDDGNMVCIKHPRKNNGSPGGGGGGGGICAVCLQEKLGHLVSSSLPTAAFPSSSSASFRSESSNSAAAAAANRTFGHSLSTNNGHGFASSSERKPRIPFLSSSYRRNVRLQRSKSTAVTSFPDGQTQQQGGRRRSFWSFLHYSNYSTQSVSSTTTPALTTATPSVRASSVRQGIIAEEEEEDGDGDRDGHVATMATSSDKVVSRSKSVGCGGSRSFSGDFFERLSTGLGVGDCTIRRAESQRQSNVVAGDQLQRKGIKERVRCGGIFGGFNLTSSSSSSSSSSQWVPTAADEARHHGTGTTATGKMNANAVATTSAAAAAHGRSRSWAWALASPLRAFAKPTSASASASASNTKNAAQPAVPSPSLLSVSS